MSEAELAALYDDAMAGGCPVVCTAVPALLEDYVGDDVDAFPRHRCDLAVDRVRGYLDDPRRRAERSALLRERGRRLDWTRLRPTYRAAYDSVTLTRLRHP